MTQLLSALTFLLAGMLTSACQSTVAPPSKGTQVAGDTSMNRAQELDPSQIVQVLPKDAIRAINAPRYISAHEAAADGLRDDEGVLGVDLGGERRAYPIAILSAHEIVNDTVGGLPIAVTW